MTSAGQAPEQKTMEEILASIRQIISDDEAKSPQRSAAQEPQAEAAPKLPAVEKATPAREKSPAREKVSRLFGQRPPGPRPVQRSPEPQQPMVDAAIDRAMDEIGMSIAPTPTPGDEPAVSATPSPRVSPYQPPADGPVLPIDDPEDDEPLPRIVRPEQPPEPQAAKPESLVSAEAEGKVGGSFDSLAAAAHSAGGRPLAALVEQTLRPILKNWLDENLPSLVERLVREEIERISRGRR